MSLFLLAAVLVGGSIGAALASAERMARQTRGMALAESLLAEIRAASAAVKDGEDGDFSPQFPDYRYHVAMAQSADLPSLRQITVTVSWDTPARIGQPAAVHSAELVGWDCHGPDAAGAETAESPQGGASGGAGGQPAGIGGGGP